MNRMALPNPWLPESVNDTAATVPEQPDVVYAPDGSFVLDEEAFMAALLDDRPAFLRSPSAAYLEAIG